LGFHGAEAAVPKKQTRRANNMRKWKKKKSGEEKKRKKKKSGSAAHEKGTIFPGKKQGRPPERGSPMENEHRGEKRVGPPSRLARLFQRGKLQWFKKKKAVPAPW